MTMNIETQICNQLYKLKSYVEYIAGGKGVETEDIYIDTILRLLEANRNGKIKKEFFNKAFMYRCAIFTRNDYHRKKNAEIRTHNDEYDYHFKAIVKSSEKQYEDIVKIDTFMEKLESLEDMRKKILILLLLQGMNHNEIAEILDISREAVSINIYRARKQFGDIDLNKTRIRELEK